MQKKTLIRLLAVYLFVALMLTGLVLVPAADAQNRLGDVRIANPSKLQECVSKCKRALKAADEHIASLTDLIQKQERYSKKLSEQKSKLQQSLEAERAKANAWYKQPQVVGIGGFLAGMLTVLLVE